MSVNIRISYFEFGCLSSFGWITSLRSIWGPVTRTFRHTCKSDTTNLTQDKTLSQKDSEFKKPRVVTVIMGKYPNYVDLRCWIRRVSLLIISEYTLNMSVSSKSVMRSYCTTEGSFKPTVSVGRSRDTCDRNWCCCRSSWSEKPGDSRLSRFSFSDVQGDGNDLQ